MNVTTPSSAPDEGQAVAMPSVVEDARSGLDRSLLHGIAWTGIARWSAQLLSWVSTLVVARLLSPGDYGLLAMAMVYLGLVQLVNEFGLSAAIVHKRDLTIRQTADLGGLSIGLGVLLLLLSLLVAKPVSNFFAEPAVRWIISLLSVTFVTSAFQILPRALLTRDLRFKQLAGLDFAEALSMALVTLALALSGAGYWALVIGIAVGRTVSTILAVYLRPHSLALPRSFASIRDPLSFGAHIVLANLTWYAYRNADVGIIGKVLGKQPLGAYSIGFTIASIPIQRINELLNRVLPGIISAVQNDLQNVRRYALGLTEALALLTFPAAAGIAIIAPDFVIAVLGEQWKPAIAPLQILAVAAAFRSLGPLLAQVLVYTGHPEKNTQYGILALLVLPPMFLAGTHWGITGVALAMLIGQPVVAIVTIYRHSFRIMQIDARRYLHSLWPAISSTLLMLAAVMVGRVLLMDTWAPGTRMVAQITLGVMSYLVALYVIHKSRLSLFLSILARLRSP